MRNLPFMVVSILAFPLALIGQHAGDSTVLLAAAAAVFLSLIPLIVFVPWHRLPPGSRIVLVIGYCVAVALLRHSAGGSTAGYGGLLLLPIINQAVYGRWRDVLASIACTTATLALPIVVFGAPLYPVSEWRRVILSVMTFTLAGLVVNRLMDQVIRQKRMFSHVIELTRDLDGPHVVARVCDAVQEVTAADLVTFMELDGEGRVRATMVDTDDLQARIEAHELLAFPLPIARVAESGESSFIADLATHPDVEQEVRAALGIASALHQPVVRGDQVLGVISVAWRKPIRRVDDDVVQAVELLAAEAAVAIERSRLVALLDRQAHRDQLTGVLNRLAWDEALTRELARVERTHEEATLALLDLDHFKAYNDAHGHLRGDQLLKGATASWTGELRTIDVLARWGGEEFVVLLPSTDVEGASVVIDRLRSVMPDGQSFSAGLVAIDGRNAHDLLKAADAALYEAKETGRARTVVAPPAAGRADLRSP